MNHQQNISEQIQYYSKQLRLPAFRTEVDNFAKQAVKQKASFQQFLLNLMQHEYQQRIINRKKERIRRAGFPYIKYLNDLIQTELPIDAQEKLTDISSLDFIKEGRNIILAGNPGTGKTHIAIGLAIQACKADYTVFFYIDTQVTNSN